MSHRFGDRRIYYNNFASHLLNAFNPNMLYPDLGYRWSDSSWSRCIDMVADFGFNSFEFWLEPRLFCLEGLSEPYGKIFAEQIDRIIDHAHRRGLTVQMLCSLATTGSQWRTLCPNDPDSWRLLRRLWTSWLERLSAIDVLSLFPGDPGACSLGGCTAETYIDRSCEIAGLAASIADCEVELGTWGPPFFGWGIIEGPEGWDGSFEQAYQDTAWRFDRSRSDRSMEHLLARLADFPDRTSVAINLGFNPDGNPGGEDDARRWAVEIAKQRPVYSWDFSLTEGENAITPHWRFDRLYRRRREEREVGVFSGGICFTMSPLLNGLSLFQAARSFSQPDADPFSVATEYLSGFFGDAGSELSLRYPVFEIVADWGYYGGPPRPLDQVHRMASEFGEILRGVSKVADPPFAFPVSPEWYRDELLFYADLYTRLSAPHVSASDLAAASDAYRRHVYAIYNELPRHVDPRPDMATRRFIDCFKERRLDHPPVTGAS